MDRRLWGWAASFLLLAGGGWALAQALPAVASVRGAAAVLAAVGLLGAGAAAWMLPDRKLARVGAGAGVATALVVSAGLGAAAATDALGAALGLLRGLDPRGLVLLVPILAVVAKLALAAGLGAWAAGRAARSAPWLAGAASLLFLTAPLASAAPGLAGVPAGAGLLAALPLLVKRRAAQALPEAPPVPAPRPGAIVALRPQGSERWLAAGPDGVVAPAVRVAGEAGSRFVVHRSREGREDWLSFCADGAFVALEAGASGARRLRAARPDVSAAALFRFDGARLWSREGRGHLVLRERRAPWWRAWRRDGAWEVGVSDRPGEGTAFEVAVLVDAPGPAPLPFADGARVTLRCRTGPRERFVGIGADGFAALGPPWEDLQVSRFVLRASKEEPDAFSLETPSGEPLGLRRVGEARAFALAKTPELLRMDRDGVLCASGERLALRGEHALVASDQATHRFWLADESALAVREVEVKEGERTLAGVSAFAAARAARLAARRKA